MINQTAYNISIDTYEDGNEQPVNVLKLTKHATARGAYDDGIYYFFGDKKPNHITLKMRTDNPSVESCDLRLTTVKTVNGSVDNLNFTKVDW